MRGQVNGLTESLLKYYQENCNITDEQIQTILRNQEIVKDLTKLVKDMDTIGTVNKGWVKTVLERILLYGIKAK